ncbi:MAG: class I SAM-dependent methyltransferase [Syntrophobacteraceae bacterium]|nr:class I SAM-dependent methyltransferase [Syntrophobacteraceae bacterium]
MSLPDINWNELWRSTQAEKHPPARDPRFWDKRAPEFTRRATGSEYVGQFLGIMRPEPHWTVLDIGCAAGTLAIPLAPSVRQITALDPSTVMLSFLDNRCREENIANIRIVNGKWEDDWSALGIGVHDVALASRSLVTDDLLSAVDKLKRHASKRVYISTLVDDGPYDRRIVEAVGRKFRHGADYILVYNMLRSLGVYANVAFTTSSHDKRYTDVEEAVNSMRWMIHEMTPMEEDRLRSHLSKSLVRENGAWKMPYQLVVRWAVLWWDV